MRKKGVTAGELMARLNADPKFVAERQRWEEERLKREMESRVAEAPLVAELRAAGYPVTSSWDLVNTRCSYPGALPILLAHLDRPYPCAVREGIARALAVREAKGVGWETLVRSFREEREKGPKDGLAAAIAAASDDEVLDEVIALCRDPRHGPSRILLLNALERSRSRRARAALMELGTDPDLTREIQVILRRLKRGKR